MGENERLRKKRATRSKGGLFLLRLFGVEDDVGRGGGKQEKRTGGRNRRNRRRYFFLAAGAATPAFCAAFVTLPPAASDLSTLLMTPTATV